MFPETLGKTKLTISLASRHLVYSVKYHKPPNISPGLIFVRKPFLMGLYTGGLIYGGGGYYGLHFVLASY